MGFVEFLVLLVIGILVSAILHFGLSYYAMPGWRSYFGKLTVGYVGALIAGTTIGTWDLGVVIEKVAVIPAILGSLGMIVLAIDLFETAAGRRGG